MEVEITEPGYLLTTLSHDAPENVDVYFDDYTIIHEHGRIVQVQDYYPYGLPFNTKILEHEVLNKYLYQGKELLDSLGWYDFEARVYAAELGRFLNIDPKSSLFPDKSPYTAMLNDPVYYTDPDGECPVCVAVAVGAAIGAAASAVVYTATALTTDTFDWWNFGKSVALGAVSGAISGGIASVAGSTASSIGFSILNNTASTVAGNAILGNEITWGTVIGGVAGGLVGGAIPQFSGVNGGSVVNIGAEVGYGAVRGGITGAVTGGVGAAVDNRPIGKGIMQGALTGAVGGAAMGVLNVGLFGPAYVPARTYGDFGKYKPIYRKGTFLTRALAGEGSGVAIGRNLITHQYRKGLKLFGVEIDVTRANNFLAAHETAHYYQQIKMGYGNFYAKTLSQYLVSPGIYNVYSTIGTLEFMADLYAYRMVGSQFIPLIK